MFNYTNNLVGTFNEEMRCKWLKQVLEEIPSGLRLLDAGAGEQQFKKHCSHLNYVSQDFAEYDGSGDGVGLQTGEWDYKSLDIVSDITNIPEADSSFDVILCTEVFEHLPEPVLAIKEFARLLKKNGQVIITAPFCSLTHFSPYHFYTGFNRYFYEKHLLDSGFLITSMVPNGNYFEFLAQEIRRIKGVAALYTNVTLGVTEQLSLSTTLKALERMSTNDRGSSELLNFGYHVIAVKK